MSSEALRVVDSTSFFLEYDDLARQTNVQASLAPHWRSWLTAGRTSDDGGKGKQSWPIIPAFVIETFPTRFLGIDPVAFDIPVDDLDRSRNGGCCRA